jgi:hypothetical protein
MDDELKPVCFTVRRSAFTVHNSHLFGNEHLARGISKVVAQGRRGLKPTQAILLFAPATRSLTLRPGRFEAPRPASQGRDSRGEFLREEDETK